MRAKGKLGTSTKTTELCRHKTLDTLPLPDCCSPITSRNCTAKTRTASRELHDERSSRDCIAKKTYWYVVNPQRLQQSAQATSASQNKLHYSTHSAHCIYGSQLKQNLPPRLFTAFYLLSLESASLHPLGSTRRVPAGRPPRRLEKRTGPRPLPRLLVHPACDPTA